MRWELSSPGNFPLMGGFGFLDMLSSWKSWIFWFVIPKGSPGSGKFGEQSAPGVVEPLPRSPKPCRESGIRIAPPKNTECFRSERISKLIPFPSLATPQPLNILGIPNFPWAGTARVAIGHLGQFFGQSQFSKARSGFQFRFRAGSDPSSAE